MFIYILYRGYGQVRHVVSGCPQPVVCGLQYQGTALQVQVRKKAPKTTTGKKSNDGKTKVQRALTVTAMAIAKLSG